MLVVADVREDRRHSVSEEDKKLFGIDRLNQIRSEIPAATHVDMSARIQTVHKETNPRYHALQHLTVTLRSSFLLNDRPFTASRSNVPKREESM